MLNPDAELHRTHLRNLGFVELTGMRNHEGSRSVRIADEYLGGIYATVANGFGSNQIDDWLVAVAVDGSLWTTIPESSQEMREIQQLLRGIGFIESPRQYHELVDAVRAVQSAPSKEILKAFRQTFLQGRL